MLQDPLDQQQQHKSRQAQNGDHQGIPQVQPQGDAGEARRQPYGPQGQKPQQGVQQQLQRQAERGS